MLVIFVCLLHLLLAETFFIRMTSESYPLTKEKNATMMGMNNDSYNKTLIITTALLFFILLFV